MAITDAHISNIQHPITSENSVVPTCIGIIMDGNRRFAREHGIPQLEGHRAGFEKLKELVGWAREAGVGSIVVYAFSTENWKRGEDEVAYLLDLFKHTLIGKALESIKREGMKIRFIGERERFSPELQKLMAQTERETEVAPGGVLGVALSYGGRAEILAAANAAIAKGTPVDEASFRDYFWSKDIPDPDLIIRTGGEERLSGFLTWQSVYSELFFTKTFWPELSKKEFLGILNAFAGRKRNFGK